MRVVGVILGYIAYIIEGLGFRVGVWFRVWRFRVVVWVFGF